MCVFRGDHLALDSQLLSLPGVTFVTSLVPSSPPLLVRLFSSQFDLFVGVNLFSSCFGSYVMGVASDITRRHNLSANSLIL